MSEPSGDRVYLKRDIAADKPFEDHPNLIFGILVSLLSACIVGSLFLPIPGVFIAIIDIIAVALVVYLVVKKNDKSNLSKSDAFIVRDGHLYHIRLGYALENGMSSDIATAARAQENMDKTACVHEARTHEETFSNYLTEILSAPPVPLDDERDVLAPKLPKYVISFCEMRHPRLERQDKDWIWISFENDFTNGERVTEQYRNAFDLSMLEGVQ